MTIFFFAAAGVVGIALVIAAGFVFVRARQQDVRQKTDALFRRAVDWEACREGRSRRRRLVLEVVAARERDERLQIELLRFERVRRRRHLYEARHASVVDSISDLIVRLGRPEPESMAMQVRNQALVLASQERAIAALSRSISDMWPARQVTREDGRQNIHATIQSLLESLERNSVKMAATEQVFLNLLSPPHPDTAALSLALHQLGGTLPAAIHLSGADMATYLHSTAFAHSTEQSALEFVNEVFPHLSDKMPALLEAAHADPHMFLGEILAIVAPPVGELAKHMGTDFLQSDQFIDVVGHFSPTISALEHIAVADGITAHIPFITIFVSMTRELNLLAQRDTDFPSSAKNFTLDVVGTAGGMAAGTALGSAVGSAVPVIGTAIGAGVGAVLGAVGGRFYTNKIKRHAFNKAHERYDLLFGEAPGKLESRHIDFCLTASERVMLAGRTVRAAIGEPPSLATSRHDEWRIIATAFRNAARADLDRALDAVAAAKKWTVSDAKLLASVAVVMPALHTAERVLRKSEQDIAIHDYGTGVSMVAIWPLQPPAEFCDDHGSEFVNLVNLRTIEASAWSQNATSEYMRQTKLLSEALSRDYRSYRADHEAIVKEVKDAEAAAEAEYRKLGVKNRTKQP